MSSRLTVGGLALLLIALVWFVWRAMGDAEAPELQSDGARTSARSEREAGDRSDARRVRSDDAALERPPVPVRSPGELVFEVVDEQGEAVVGAEILGRRPEPPPNRRHATRDPDDANDVISAVGRDPARRERLGRSGTTGELRLEGTTWDSIWTAGGSADLIVLHAAFLPEHVEVTPDQRSARVVLREGASISGRLLANEDEHVADVEVLAVLGNFHHAQQDVREDAEVRRGDDGGDRWSYIRRTRTDAEGRFVFRGLVDRPHFVRVGTLGLATTLAEGGRLIRPRQSGVIIPVRRLFVAAAVVEYEEGGSPAPEFFGFMNRWNWPAHMRHPDIGTVAAVRRVEHAVRSIHPAASVTVLIEDDGKVDEDAARSGLVLYIGPDGYHWEGVLPYVFAREFRERDLVRIRLPGAAPAPAHVEISSPFAIGLSMQKPAHQMRPIFPMRVGDGRWSFSGPPGRYEVWCWDAIAVSAPRGALMTLDLVAGENPPVVVPTNENWPLVGRLRIRVRNAVGGPTSIRRMTITGLEPSSFSQSYEGDVLGTGIDVLVPCGPVEVSVIDLEGRVAAKESVEVDSAGRDVTLTLDDTP